jgi:hypothetical protein
LNGHAGPTEKVTRKMSWHSPHFFEVLFSTEHGLFLWTPLALVAVAGLVWLCVGRRHSTTSDVRWVAALLLLMFVLQVYVSGSVESWTVAGAFGQRRFVALTPVLAVGLAAWMPVRGSAPRHVVTAALVAALCVWWNLGLMAQFGLHLMDRQRLTPLENARVTFVDLPRQAPSIAWRYFTDRESLFGLPRR